LPLLSKGGLAGDRKNQMPSQKREPTLPGVVENFPVLPLRDIVVFPHMIVPLFVGREKSIRQAHSARDADERD
jgi:ATP-dependent Lon protease